MATVSLEGSITFSCSLPPVFLGMFEKREGRLREERDMARQEAELALRGHTDSESRAKDMEGRMEALSRELEVNIMGDAFP